MPSDTPEKQFAQLLGDANQIRISIEPAGFSESRVRPGATQHRLNSRDDKWAAYGVGSVTDTAPEGMIALPISGD